MRQCENPNYCRKVAVKKVTATLPNGTSETAYLCAYCAESVTAPGCELTIR